MTSRVQVIADMRVGLPRQLQLLRIVATSVVRHQLMAYVPSVTMESAWHDLASSIGAGPQGWAREILPYA
eukprot:395367-Amphidinium_carterae.1